MFNTVQSLAEEYFAITGRPIATMTVAEFIAFKQAASASGFINDADYTASYNSLSAPCDTNKNAEMEHLQEKEDYAPANVSSNTSSIKTNTIPMPGNKNKNTNDIALSMLRSVNG